MNDSTLALCRLSPTPWVGPPTVDLQRFARKSSRPQSRHNSSGPAHRLSKLAGPWQRSRLRGLGRVVPWNLGRRRATQLLRELQPVALASDILAPFQKRPKLQRNQREVRSRVARFVTRARERGVPAGVIRYEGRKYADALTAIPRTLERNLAMEEAIERSGLRSSKYYLRGLRNSP